jgi:hypothetical protein
MAGKRLYRRTLRSINQGREDSPPDFLFNTVKKDKQ